MNLLSEALVVDLREAFNDLALMPVEERIEAINALKVELHKLSPFANEPVDCVLWVKGELVEANDYNPNSVAPPEMKTLELSSVLLRPAEDIPNAMMERLQQRFAFSTEVVRESVRRFQAFRSGDESIGKDGSLEWEEPILSQQKVFHPGR